jgi:hypothetical protein
MSLPKKRASAGAPHAMSLPALLHRPSAMALPHQPGRAGRGVPGRVSVPSVPRSIRRYSIAYSFFPPPLYGLLFPEMQLPECIERCNSECIERCNCLSVLKDATLECIERCNCPSVLRLHYTLHPGAFPPECIEIMMPPQGRSRLRQKQPSGTRPGRGQRLGRGQAGAARPALSTAEPRFRLSALASRGHSAAFPASLVTPLNGPRATGPPASPPTSHGPLPHLARTPSAHGPLRRRRLGSWHTRDGAT